MKTNIACKGETVSTIVRQLHFTVKYEPQSLLVHSFMASNCIQFMFFGEKNYPSQLIAFTEYGVNMILNQCHKKCAYVNMNQL